MEDEVIIIAVGPPLADEGRRTYLLRPATLASTATTTAAATSAAASIHRRQDAAVASSAAAVAAEQDEEMQAATQSTLLELLSNPALHPSSVTRFLSAFPVIDRSRG